MTIGETIGSKFLKKIEIFSKIYLLKTYTLY